MCHWWLLLRVKAEVIEMEVRSRWTCIVRTRHLALRNCTWQCPSELQATVVVSNITSSGTAYQMMSPPLHPCPPSGAGWRLTYSAALRTLTNSVYCSDYTGARGGVATLKIPCDDDDDHVRNAHFNTKSPCWPARFYTLQHRDILDHSVESMADLPGRRSLRSVSTSRLVMPSSRLPTVGSWTFSVSGPRMWNALPEDVVSAPSLSTFRRRL